METIFKQENLVFSKSVKHFNISELRSPPCKLCEKTNLSDSVCHEVDIEDNIVTTLDQWESVVMIVSVVALLVLLIVMVKWKQVILSSIVNILFDDVLRLLMENTLDVLQVQE